MWLCALFCLIFVGGALGEINYGGEYLFTQQVNLQHRGLSIDGYQIKTRALIESLRPDLLSVKFDDLRFFVPSKKSSDILKETKSSFDYSTVSPFLIEISDGLVKNIYSSTSDDSYSLILKKSFSSLFQFQTYPSERVETDLCGSCTYKYSVDGSIIKKSKINCQKPHWSLKNNILGSSIETKGFTEINISGDQLKYVDFNENINIQLSIANFIESIATTRMTLTLVEEIKPDGLVNDGIEKIIDSFSKKLNEQFTASSMSIDSTQPTPNPDPSKEFSGVLKKNVNGLLKKNIGSKKSALAALNVVEAIKLLPKEEFKTILNNKSNKKILPQLLDILGAIQTPSSHEAAKDFLQMSSESFNLDLCERYLWALSTSHYHEKFIILDLLELLKGEIKDLKLLETLMQTIAAMTRKFFEDSNDSELCETVLAIIISNLQSCEKSDDLCQRIYLKALKNLKHPNAVQTLVDYAVNYSKRTGVRALKALQALGRDNWNDQVLQVAEQAYQANGTFDSSAKIVALDILLDSKNPPYLKLVHVFKKRFASPELKEYLLQRLAKKSEMCPSAKSLIESAFRHEGLHHYDTFAQGGFSTAFDRKFMENGVLSTAQEVKNGLLKQGFVNINLFNKGLPETVFSLGLFSNGLGSFLGGSSEEEEDDGEESSAGLELTVLGTELRPFILFEGQGELMGHVFSGAGSTLTPAYQAVVLLDDQSLRIPLATGELLSVDLISVGSVDLSGKIEISIWSRTADVLVQNSAGLAIKQVVKLNSPYIHAESVVELSAEPQLKMTSDVQFSGKVALCLKLEQPETSIACNTSSSSAVKRGSFKSKKRLGRKIDVPGVSFALNSKNDNMCRTMYLDS